jgi:putative DNA methylase
LYPQVEITPELAKDRPDLQPLLGQKLTVIAWLWARTVHSPNPAFSHIAVPLASTFVLSSKDKKEAYVHPVIEGDSYRFTVRMGTPTEEAEVGTVSRAGGVCLLSGAPMAFKYLRDEAKHGRFGARLMAIVAEGERGRIYLSPTTEMSQVAASAQPDRFSETEICHWPGRTNVVEYGMTKFLDLFTPRQLVALTTFSDLVGEVRNQIAADALACGWSADPTGLDAGGSGALAYAEAVSVYLAFAVDKMCDRGSSICGWDSSRDSLRNTFGRQAIPMVWDFAEANFIEQSAGSFDNALDQGGRVIKEYLPAIATGTVHQADAQTQKISIGKSISSDPPYYDNIGYADLSDFFYVWLRKALRESFPQLLATMAVPKA